MVSTATERLLVGQFALVTGAGRGIGRATAIALAVAGATVAIVARNPQEISATSAFIEASGSRTLTIPCDVSDPNQVEAMANAVAQQFGPLNLLINNAGTGGPFGPIIENDANEWWRCLEVNLRGPLLCVKAFLPAMLARGRGRIINVASGAGTVPIPSLSAYVTSKTALIRFSEILAEETAEQGIKVFAIEPGTVRTAMAEELLLSPAGKKWLPWFERIFSEGRDVSAERSAQFILALATGRADSLSGRFLTVHDDLEALAATVQDSKSRTRSLILGS